jgi:hypothetical protein
LEEIAFARGALVDDKKLVGMEARLTMMGDRAVIAISTQINNRQRRRFSIAHELGHLEPHPKVTSYTLCTQADIQEGGAREQGVDRESEANLFASALLLPRRFFAALCQQEEPSLEVVSQLAQQFDTSLTATGIRYVQFSDEPVAWVFSQDGQVRWFRSSPAFAELHLYIDVRGKLDPSTVASKYFRDGSVPSRQRRLPIASWIEPGQYRQDATINAQKGELQPVSEINYTPLTPLAACLQDVPIHAMNVDASMNGRMCWW